MSIEQLEYSVCYSTITPESVENGDFDDSGFKIESYMPDDFADVVSLVERYGCCYWSNSDNTGWLSSGYSVDDYVTMTDIEYTIHPKNERSARYLKLALEASRV